MLQKNWKYLSVHKNKWSLFWTQYTYTVYSHKDFFWLPFKPTSAAKQTIIFLHPGKHFKAFLTFKPQFRDVVWPNSFPTTWQVRHALCTEPNKHSELLWQPSTLPAHPCMGRGESWPHPHCSHWLLVNSQEYLHCTGKLLQVRGKILSFLSSNRFWIKCNLFHCYKGVDVK